ncbi:hypothetical protein H6S82_03685 [Planktothrix sp. FACHB-1355]|uniref:Tse2 ADP-ribosyltransferase toxin domain-containing protein n=2 Tax=Cyanophyceae TaxID=3028117 RepID=A0A926V9A5_9CYAN|nr:hypothetical protein [Aerosakkonema funiforme FACHB-1375]MBD3557958.1 hypothetical protein [Planktothrix sp. FACHB-1355]
MRKTPIALYRQGNANSPRMDNVRSQDVETYEQNDRVWVVANSGGISTFATQGAGKNWWKLDAGTDIPSELTPINDYGNHWSWEPSYTMLVDEYKAALRLIGASFYKVS